MAFLTAPVGLQPLHQRHQRREEIRVALQGCAQETFDFGIATAGLIQHRQVEVRFGAFEQVCLYGLVLANRGIPAVLGRAQAVARDAEQIPCGSDAHGSHRVVQQGRQQRCAFRRRQEGADRANGALTHLRCRVAEVLGGQFQCLFARVRRQLGEQRRPLDGRQIAALQLLEQGLGSTGLTVADQPQAFIVAGGLQCTGAGAVP
ncbi:hypothetical protein D3C81_1261330 [compost metagenome]